MQKVRPILTKLMAAGTGPQRGLFNVPVDPVKLGIPDYFKRVPKPMDLVRVISFVTCDPSNKINVKVDIISFFSALLWGIICLLLKRDFHCCVGRLRMSGMGGLSSVPFRFYRK